MIQNEMFLVIVFDKYSQLRHIGLHDGCRMRIRTEHLMLPLGFVDVHVALYPMYFFISRCCLRLLDFEFGFCVLFWLFGIVLLHNIDIPLLYWIPKLHKYPYKERYVAGSSACFTKSLSKQLTTILSAIKDGLQTYCETIYSHSGINQMWILILRNFGQPQI